MPLAEMTVVIDGDHGEGMALRASIVLNTSCDGDQTMISSALSSVETVTNSW